VTGQRPTRDDPAGRAYLDLRRAAHADGRLTDEYLRGIIFDPSTVHAEQIRDEDIYSGVRVSLTAGLATAVIRFHVGINIGDPIWPEPDHVHLPRLLGTPCQPQSRARQSDRCETQKHRAAPAACSARRLCGTRPGEMGGMATQTEA
jgi:hypothetical protein